MCRYFKLSWNTTALSQSDCRNFPDSSIKGVIAKGKNWENWVNKECFYFLEKDRKARISKVLKESSRLSQNFMNQARSVICSEDKGNPTKTVQPFLLACFF